MKMKVTMWVTYSKKIKRAFAARAVVGKTLISTLKMTFTESTIKFFVEYI